MAKLYNEFPGPISVTVRDGGAAILDGHQGLKLLQWILNQTGADLSYENQTCMIFKPGRIPRDQMDLFLNELKEVDQLTGEVRSITIYERGGGSDGENTDQASQDS